MQPVTAELNYRLPTGRWPRPAKPRGRAQKGEDERCRGCIAARQICYSAIPPCSSACILKKMSRMYWVYERDSYETVPSHPEIPNIENARCTRKQRQSFLMGPVSSQCQVAVYKAASLYGTMPCTSPVAPDAITKRRGLDRSLLNRRSPAE